MKISIVTAAYNASQYLPDLIDSIVGQTYPPFEHIIIDDGSTDDTPKVLAAYANSHPFVRWWTHENQGAYPTQDKALRFVTGDIICLINADDKFASPDVFHQVVDYWQHHSTCQIVYGQTWRMDNQGNPLPNLDPHWKPSQWLIRHISYVQHCSMFVRREFVEEYQLNLHYHLAADWDWIIRLFQNSQSIGYMTQPIGVFRLHDGQRSRTKQHQATVERRQIVTQYHGSYFISSLLHRLLIYRGMFLLGWDVLRQKGLSAFINRMRLWIKKRLSIIVR